MFIKHEIRPATESDMHQICDIYNHYIRNTVVTFDLSERDEESFAREMTALSKEFPLLVATQGETVLGYAYANKWKNRKAYDQAVESSIYMDPEFTSKGIGYHLYLSLINHLRKEEVHSMIAGISLPNVTSVRLHEKLGFHKVAHFREIGRKFDKWIDVGYWELILPAKK